MVQPITFQYVCVRLLAIFPCIYVYPVQTCTKFDFRRKFQASVHDNIHVNQTLIINVSCAWKQFLNFSNRQHFLPVLIVQDNLHKTMLIYIGLLSLQVENFLEIVLLSWYNLLYLQAVS
jgi:hypothetical protein